MLFFQDHPIHWLSVDELVAQFRVYLSSLILDLFFSTELSVLVQSLFFSLHIGRRKTVSELVQKVQLKRTNLFEER